MSNYHASHYQALMRHCRDDRTAHPAEDDLRAAAGVLIISLQSSIRYLSIIPGVCADLLYNIHGVGFRT